MIIYSEIKANFKRDVIDRRIEEILRATIFEKMHRNTSESEIRSWQNSLLSMAFVLSESTIPDDVCITIEYNIPQTSKRVDLIVSGYDENNNNSAIIIELKQWEKAELILDMDGIVKTFVGGANREVTHPSYQALSYAESIYNFNADIQDRDARLHPCSYLHNYSIREEDTLLNPIYKKYLEKAPLFSKNDGTKLKNYLEKNVLRGDDGETIKMIEEGRLRPSKSLQDSIRGMIAGNRDFILLDEQKVAYELAMRAVRTCPDGKRKTLIVSGGPGTGKSVLAINLLADITNNLGKACKYVSKNDNPRNVYKTKLKGSRKTKDIDILFSGSGSFCNVRSSIYDVLIVDEAHRLRMKSGLYSNMGENQVKEIINASKVSIFLIDEHQRVTLEDIGSRDEILRWAKEFDSEVIETSLPSQFRCNGSDGYLSWLDDVLYGCGTANYLASDIGYDIKLFDDPCELLASIKAKNEVNNKSRMVAGYCWEWDKRYKDDPDVHDVTIPDTDFGMSWNLGNTNTWAIDEGSIDQIGCIHTCQGLEFDYVGVIIGDDLIYRDGKVRTDRSKHPSQDKALHGIKTKYKDPAEAEAVADILIKNTYRTLMSRGMKGCYVYCTDAELRKYMKQRIDSFNKDCEDAYSVRFS